MRFFMALLPFTLPSSIALSEDGLAGPIQSALVMQATLDDVANGPTLTLELTPTQADMSELRLVTSLDPRDVDDSSQNARVLVRVRRPPVDKRRRVQTAFSTQQTNVGDDSPGVVTLFPKWSADGKINNVLSNDM